MDDPIITCREASLGWRSWARAIRVVPASGVAGVFCISLLSACTSQDKIASEKALFEFHKLFEQCISLFSACSSQDGTVLDKNESLAEFYEFSGQCRGDPCQEEFLKDKACNEALEAKKSSISTVKNKQEYIAWLQVSLLFSDAYSEWLEVRAGKSIIRSGPACGTILQNVYPRESLTRN